MTLGFVSPLVVSYFAYGSNMHPAIFEGVRAVEIDFEARTATVIFDTAATSAAVIATASANAGYPARVAG